MWCELAIVLGGTVRELQQRMTIAEYQTWLSYRQKYGPMNDIRRYDRPAALIAYIGSRLGGGKAAMKDFMPFGMDQEATLEEIMKAFGGVNIGKPR